MKAGLAIGQRWTFLGIDRTYVGAREKVIAALIITGETEKGRIRVLKAERVETSCGDIIVDVKSSAMRADTILNCWEQSDLEFLIKYGGPIDFIKQCMRDSVEDKKHLIRQMESDIIRTKYEVSTLEKVVKEVLDKHQ